MVNVSKLSEGLHVSWHTMIRDIGKSSSGEIITNSQSLIIRENTFIIRKLLY
jgi:hypothetical protein